MIELLLKGGIDIGADTGFHLVQGIHPEKKNIEEPLSRSLTRSHQNSVTADDNTLQAELHVPYQLVFNQRGIGVQKAGHPDGADILDFPGHILSSRRKADHRPVIIATLIPQILPAAFDLVGGQDLQHHLSRHLGALFQLYKTTADSQFQKIVLHLILLGDPERQDSQRYARTPTVQFPDIDLPLRFIQGGIDIQKKNGIRTGLCKYWGFSHVP